MTAFLSNIAGPLVMFGIASLVGLAVWIVKGQFAQQKMMGDLRAILVGPDGQNGLRGDMKSTKAAVHELRDGFQRLSSRMDVKDVQDEQRDEKIDELRADFADHVRGGGAPAVHQIAAGRRASTRGRE